MTTLNLPEPFTSDAGGPAPTIVFAHGAWADASSWSGQVEALQAAGFPVKALPNGVQSLDADARNLANVLATIEGPVVLVGHSYGGTVITNAAAHAPNVKALVYVDAVVPDVGEANIALIGADSVLNADPATLYDDVDYAGAPDGAKAHYLKENVFLANFAASVPPVRAAVLYAEQRAAADPAFSELTRETAWRTIPSWAFISTGDVILTPAAKTEQAERAGAKITIHEGGSHLTLVSDPDAVTEVVARAIRSLS